MINKKIMGVLITSALLIVAGCGGDKDANKSVPASNEKITISAAASLQNAMDEIKGNYIKQHGLKAEQIAINYGGSGTLRQQIEQGAPVNIFISASEAHMKTLQDKGLMDQVQPLTKNSLVLIVPKDRAQVKIDQLANAGKIAIGTPETVPAGKYAQLMFEKLNMWNSVEPKIVYAKDVRAVLNYVIQGAVDAGLVYKTDALEGKDKVVITDTAPAGTHPDIIYPIGMIKSNENSLTKDFFQYMNSTDAKNVLIKYGFGGN